MHRVLIPTDFSDNAWNAINYAISMYRGEETVFFLFNSYSPNAINPGEVMTSSAATKTLLDAVKSSSVKGLKKSLEKIMSGNPDEKHRFEAISKFDYFTNAVTEVCREEEIDMVVMGTTGASGLKEALVGSNTASLIGKIKIPLLAIPESSSFTSPGEIAFATDYDTEYRERNLEVLFHIADKFSSVIRIYHVIQKKAELTEKNKQVREEMEKRFSGHRHEFFLLTDTSLATATRIFVQSRGIQMLCMVAKKHSFLQHLFGLSHTRDMCYHIDIPLLILQNEVG
ncbi:universal stress protein [Sinomicrobium weinanense]|uniref:Universal stress protein n=1 Tax=Sinomicrobium weinanense TaxID=2842200 RepID=A0A926JWT8_9FLAO|nr:universal stress protein [Sinomicrobium weinanense]MBC9798627.1 universal stress protein [Sinomicrobium weinanense]MBU3122480.1 universal stress protein [Sinomicrobium weinanense]